MDARIFIFGVKVSDYERSLTFYRDKLGLEVSRVD
ncbi:MAG: VOC family protein, partial [Candidatus Riflebacteria bacterium]|nr:VOC family protein [Candidatus Riflebacteria bacterium]